MISGPVLITVIILLLLNVTDSSQFVFYLCQISRGSLNPNSRVLKEDTTGINKYAVFYLTKYKATIIHFPRSLTLSVFVALPNLPGISYRFNRSFVLNWKFPFYAGDLKSRVSPRILERPSNNSAISILITYKFQLYKFS